MSLPAAPRKQHTVSKALLREFTDKGQLIKYDLAYRKSYPRSPSAVGYHVDYVSVFPQEFENLWKRTEDRLPAAIAGIRKPGWPGRHRDIDTIKEAVMVHFVRNRALREWERRNIPVYLRQVRDEIWLEDKPRVRRAYERRARRPNAPDAEVRQWLDAIEPSDDLLTGSGFAQRLLDMLKWASEWVKPLTIQIVVAGGSVPFILSDSPVVPFKDDLLVTGYGRVALGDAQGVLLPVSPRRLVCIANNAGERAVDDASVRRLNFEQVNSAVEYLIYHPAIDMRPWLAEVVPLRR
jgi:hypothetical protein